MKKSTTDNFFDTQAEKSFVKSFIVTEFFKVYFSIINHAGFSDDIYYIDLFSGPGVYNDGTLSTPMLLLNQIDAFESNDIRDKLHLIFNDENTQFYNTLKEHVEKHPVYNRLKHKPQITNLKASQVDLSSYLSGKKPKFSFIDPWGYVDVSAERIGELVKSIGSDCVLFFNSNRILQDLSKDQSQAHMNKIFGSLLTEAINTQKNTLLTQQQKSRKFVSLFSQNLYNTYFQPLKSQGYRLFVLPFAIDQDSVDKTSHYIVFISKNHKAVYEMKKIMLKKSNTDNTTLGFDMKDKYTISMFSRADDVDSELKKIVIEMLNSAPTLKSKYFTPEEWLYYLDLYQMSKIYEVTPYTRDEIKHCIGIWDAQGKIEIESLNSKMRARITYSRKVKFSKDFGV